MNMSSQVNLQTYNMGKYDIIIYSLLQINTWNISGIYVRCNNVPINYGSVPCRFYNSIFVSGRKNYRINFHHRPCRHMISAVFMYTCEQHNSAFLLHFMLWEPLLVWLTDRFYLTSIFSPFSRPLLPAPPAPINSLSGFQDLYNLQRSANGLPALGVS